MKCAICIHTPQLFKALVVARIESRLVVNIGGVQCINIISLDSACLHLCHYYLVLSTLLSCPIGLGSTMLDGILVVPTFRLQHQLH